MQSSIMLARHTKQSTINKMNAERERENKAWLRLCALYKQKDSYKAVNLLLKHPNFLFRFPCRSLSKLLYLRETRPLWMKWTWHTSLRTKRHRVLEKFWVGSAHSGRCRDHFDILQVFAKAGFRLPPQLWIWAIDYDMRERIQLLSTGTFFVW